MKQVAFLPLDDRPCNLSQVERLASIAGIELRTPRLESLKSKSAHYPYLDIQSWLKQTLPQVEVVIISADFFIYGGLIRSRKMEITQAEALKRANRLLELQRLYPQIKFYLSNVILRLSITIDGEQKQEDWENIFSYSTLSDPRHPDPHAQSKAKALEKLIPPPLLNEYLAARKRNHQVNLLLASPENSAAFTLLGQEDCAPFGLHQAEKEILSLSATQNVQILTGADEMSSLLLLKSYMNFHHIKTQSIPMETFPSHSSGWDQISLYEDVSVQANWDQHLKCTPFFEKKGGVPVRIKMFSDGGQKDLCIEKAAAQSSTEAQELKQIEEFVRQLNPGDAVLDLSLANGAHPLLLPKLLKKIPLNQMQSFSAWNTTGNRMGTLLAHLGLKLLAQKTRAYEPRADKTYLLIHLLDDGLYQSQIRAQLFSACGSLSCDPWNLGSAHSQISEQAQTLLQAAALELGLPALSAHLPWPRIFEAEITPLL